METQSRMQTYQLQERERIMANKKETEIVLNESECTEIKGLLDSIESAKGDQSKLDNYNQKIIDFMRPRVPAGQTSVTIHINGLRIKYVLPYKSNSFSPAKCKELFPEIYEKCREVIEKPQILDIHDESEKPVKKKKVDPPTPSPVVEEVVDPAIVDGVQFTDGTLISNEEFDALTLEQYEELVKAHGEVVD